MTATQEASSATPQTIVPINNQSVALTPIDILNRAIAQGAPVDIIERLTALYERWERNLALRAYNNAIADARSKIPVIAKKRHVGFDSKKPGAARTDYWYEDLAEIARTVDPILNQHGLSYRWRTSSTPNEPVTVTCIISHRNGHSEENPLSAARDETGNKNSIQAVGSTVTYLQRYTLKAALGLAASSDDDGMSGGNGTAQQRLTPEQAQAIKDRLRAAKASEARFLKWAKVDCVEDILAEYYESCIEAIQNIGKGKSK